jgi:uncharacterized protein (DUF3820 family)
MQGGELDPRILEELAKTRMPFGKYKGRLLLDLPEPYVVWFSQKGFPAGRLGQLLNIVYEVKLNGLEQLFAPLRNQ